MRYYMDVTKYANDGSYSFKTEKIPMNDVDLNDNLKDVICVEFYRKKKIGKDKSISSLIYNGIEEEKNGYRYFRTSHDDEFYINDFDTNLNDFKKLIQDVKQSDGIYAYFDKSINKEVTVKCLVEYSRKKYKIHEFKGILKLISCLGYICLEDARQIDFNSIYSISGENINYVNPFVFYSKRDYEEYFSLIENSAFREEECYSLKRKK